MMIKVSVIMPCLNAIKYLAECMDSIVGQTLKDMEFIIVDGGSTDGTLEILEEYKNKDDRIRVVHSKAKSVGHDYNIGMDVANGKYIGFCEMDDYVDPTMWETLYQWAEENDSDYVKSDFYMFVGNGDERKRVTYRVAPQELKDKVLSVSEYKNILLSDLNMWNGIYKRSFLQDNNIRLNETKGAAFQDMGFVLQVNMLAKRGLYKSLCFYNYRRDNSGSSTYSPNIIHYVVDEMRYMSNFLDKHQELMSFKEILCKRFVNSFFAKLDTIIKKNQSFDDVQDEIQYFQHYVKKIWNESTRQQLLEAELWYDLRVRMFMESVELVDKYIRICLEMSLDRREDFIESFQEKNRIIIVGCGERGRFLHMLFKARNFMGEIVFADNNEELWGSEYMGSRIMSIEQATKEFSEEDFIVSVANGVAKLTLKKQLMELNISEEQIKFCVEIGPHMITEIGGI